MDAHRGLIESEYLADLAGRVSLELAQHHHYALPIGQLVNRDPKLGAPLIRKQRLFGRRLVR